MPANVYIDESIRRDKYILVACFVNHQQHQSVRRELKKLRQRGSETIHMYSEPLQRQKVIAHSVVEMDIRSIVVSETLLAKPVILARSLCLQTMGNFESIRNAHQMTLDSSNSLRLDRKILSDKAYEFNGVFPQYRHLSRRQEPLLWLPDIVAWCVGKGGNFAKMMESISTNPEATTQ